MNFNRKNAHDYHDLSAALLQLQTNYSILQYIYNCLEDPRRFSKVKPVQVSMNKHGDLVIFLSSLGTNGATVIIALLMISLLKRLLPAVFKRGHQAAAEQRLEQRDLAEEGRTEGMDKDGDDGDKHGLTW